MNLEISLSEVLYTLNSYKVIRLLSCLCLSLLLRCGIASGQPAILHGEGVPDSLLTIKGDSLRLSRILTYARRSSADFPGHSISIAREALQEAKEKRLGEVSRRGAMIIGDIYSRNADYPRALSYYLEALQIARKTQQYGPEVDALKEISIIYMREKDMSKSMQFLKMADSIALGHNLTGKMPDLLSEMGVRYAEAQQYDSAIACYRQAIAIAQQQKMTGDELTAMGNMAVSLKNKKQYKEALSVYKACFKIAEGTNDALAIAILTGNVANLYYESGDFAASERYVLEALRLSTTLTNNRMYVQQDMYSLLVKLYERKQQYAQAFAAQKRLSELKDSLFNDQSAQQLQEAGVRFDTELKDSRIAAQQNEIKNRKRTILFLSIGAVLLLGAGVVTYVNQVRVRRLNRQVTAQKKELEKLNGVKDRIFSAISHDIRTPLSSLFSLSRLLSEGKVSPEKLPLYTNQLNGQISYTMSMMDNLLHWGRSQMQGFHPVPESIGIRNIADEVITFARPEATQKGVVITRDIPEGLMAIADKQMVTLILRNLIHNAIKYSSKGGSISVSGNSVAGSIVLSVADTGVGIEAARVENFNTEQGPMESHAGTAGEKGTGLGLLLCRSFAAIMGGGITLSSKPGAGSCFTLTLPATVAALPVN